LGAGRDSPQRIEWIAAILISDLDQALVELNLVDTPAAFAGVQIFTPIVADF
jgi:hypothetical protein